MRTNTKWLVGALIGLHFSDLQAADWSPEAEQAFAYGGRLFENGDYGPALEQFRIAQGAGMQTSPVLYNIGVCQYRIGDFAGSELTFRRIAGEYRDWYHLAQYNIGLALIRQDRIEEADGAFNEARNSDDTSVIALADAMLQRIAEKRRAATPATITSPYNAFIEVGIGYDDNLALLDETNISAGVTTDSTFGEFFGQIGGTPGFADNFRYDASAYLVHYPDASRFDQAVLRLNGEWAWRLDNWHVAAGPYYAYSTLDGDGYDQRLGLGASIGRPLTARSHLAIRFAYEEIGELESQYEFIDGSRQLIGLRYLLHDGPHRLHLRYEYSVDDRVGASVSPIRHGLRAGYQRHIDANWTAGAELSLRHSIYDDLIEPRDEDLHEIAIVIARQLSKNWQFTGEYRYSNNDSNISQFAYQRHRATLGLNRVF
jgi:tetratricopeptide (TPR) repeat protein